MFAIRTIIEDRLYALAIDDEYDVNSISNLDENSQTLLRRRRIGFVFQKVHLLPMLKAIENVMVPMRLDGIDLNVSRPKAIAALNSVGMGNKQENRPGELSGGEAQRVAIARALVMSPAILLADEPTGALDSANSQIVIELFRTLVTERNQTLVIVTHDPTVAAAADRVIKMRDGRIVNDSSCSQRHNSTANASADSNRR